MKISALCLQQKHQELNTISSYTMGAKISYLKKKIEIV